ncbi:MAG: alpha/beta fold hydrolase [Hyphomicrobiaceae bacterium]
MLRQNGGYVMERLAVVQMLAASIAMMLLGPDGPAMGQQPPAGSTAQSSYSTTRVFFVTNRQPTAPRTTFGIKWRHEFGSRRGTAEFGIAEVTLPDIREPYTVPRPMTNLGKQDPARHTIVTNVSGSTRDEFFRALNAAVSGQQNRRIIVFVHGFNTGFAEPIYMLAAIRADLGHPVVMFSWPSHGNLYDYQADQTAAEWSQADLSALLRDIFARLPGTPITLAAHSLGTRMSMAVLKDLVADGQTSKAAQAIDELVLAAPDFDVDTFIRDYARLATSRRTSLFFSQSDLALAMSAQFHRADRLGNQPPHKLDLPASINKIDLSALRSNWLGHSYHRSAIYLTRALQSQFPKDRISIERFKLDVVPMIMGNDRFWRVEPQVKSQ